MLSFIAILFSPFFSPSGVDAKELCRNFTFEKQSCYQLVVRVNLPGKCPYQNYHFSVGDIDGGHVSIGMLQIKRDTTIGYTIGFYPEGGITLFNFRHNLPSVLKDDKTRPVDFVFMLDLSPSEFKLVLDRLVELSGTEFNLYTFNCVDFCSALLGTVDLHFIIKKNRLFNGELNYPLELRNSVRGYVSGKNERRLRINVDCPDI